MLLVAPGLATRNKRPLDPKASPLIENEEAGMRKRQSKRKRSRGAINLIPSTAQRRRWFEIVKREGTPSRVPAEF